MSNRIKKALRQLYEESPSFSKLYVLAHKVKTKCLQIIPDELYLKIKYKEEIGRKLNLESPESYTEKLQWLKLYDRNPLYIQLVDKYRVREYIKERIGEQYLVPLYGVWDRPECMNFDELPDSYVLKTNHDSEGVIICKKSELVDRKKTICELKKRIHTNLFWFSREWPYKNVQKKVIAEKYLVDSNICCDTEGLVDYKFYCFNGIPKFFHLSFANIKNGRKRDVLSLYNLDWTPTVFYRKDHEPFPFHIEKPVKWEEMVSIAKKLSEGIPFVRVDLYYIQNEIYFSELTFYPGGGFGRFYPDEWERRIGEWIQLPEKRNE